MANENVGDLYTFEELKGMLKRRAAGCPGVLIDDAGDPHSIGVFTSRRFCNWILTRSGDHWILEFSYMTQAPRRYKLLSDCLSRAVTEEELSFDDLVTMTLDRLVH